MYNIQARSNKDVVTFVTLEYAPVQVRSAPNYIDHYILHALE